MLLHDLLVSLAEVLGNQGHLLPRLDIDEASRFVEGEIDLVLVEHMEDDEVVSAAAEVVHGVEDLEGRHDGFARERGVPVGEVVGALHRGVDALFAQHAERREARDPRADEVLHVAPEALDIDISALPERRGEH